MQWNSYVGVAKRSWFLFLFFLLSLFLPSVFPLLFHVHGFACLTHPVSFFYFLCRCHCFCHRTELLKLLVGCTFHHRTIRTMSGPHFLAGGASRPQGRWLVAGGRVDLLFVNMLVACGGRWVSSGCPQGVPSLPIWVTALMGRAGRMFWCFFPESFWFSFCLECESCKLEGNWEIFFFFCCDDVGICLEMFIEM